MVSILLVPFESVMDIRNKTGKPKPAGAFTLMETIVAFAIVTMVSAGIVSLYMQADRMAKFSSLSLAAQSLAVRGAERMRAASWDGELYPYTNGIGTGDELVGTKGMDGTITTNVLDIPQTGTILYATNFLSVTTNQSSPQVRQLKSSVTWTFRLTGAVFTNTIITLRAPDD
jgi:type II secretory pathway pseudopilin PulG